MDKIKESYLELEKSFSYDESVEKCQYRVYDLPQGTELNANGQEIRFKF